MNRMAELWKEAGLPDGVFNVLHGDKVAVEPPARRPDIKAVSFVGSTPIAKYVYQTATARKARPGPWRAKNHMIVLPDADLDLAADAPSMPDSNWWLTVHGHLGTALVWARLPMNWWTRLPSARLPCAPATDCVAATWVPCARPSPGKKAAGYIDADEDSRHRPSSAADTTARRRPEVAPAASPASM